MSEIFTIPTVGGPAGPPGPDSAALEFGAISRDGTGLQAITVAASPQQYAASTWTNGLASGITPDGALDRIVMDTTGFYAVFLQVSHTFTATARITWQLRKNGLLAASVGFSLLGTPFFPNSGSSAGIVTITAGDILSIFVSTTVNGTVSVIKGQLYVERLDP